MSTRQGKRLLTFLEEAPHALFQRPTAGVLLRLCWAARALLAGVDNLKTAQVPRPAGGTLRRRLEEDRVHVTLPCGREHPTAVDLLRGARALETSMLHATANTHFRQSHPKTSNSMYHVQHVGA